MTTVQEDELRGTPLLIVANKSDLEAALPAADITKALNLAGIKDRPWSIRSASALSGDGLDDAFRWYLLCRA